METLLRPGWYIAFTVFVLHQFVQYGLGWSIPFLDAYLDPVLCLPIVLGMWIAEAEYIYGFRRLKTLELIVVGTFLAVLFEEGFPRWQPAFVRDWWDYLAYALGGLWYWLWLNPSGPEGTQP